MKNYLDYELRRLIADVWADDTTTISGLQTGNTSEANGRVEFAIPVLGHDPKNVEVSITEGSIKITALKGDVKGVLNYFCSDISETITLPKNLDGLTSKAEIKNGILLITIDKKEEHKPKKLLVKF